MCSSQLSSHSWNFTLSLSPLLSLLLRPLHLPFCVSPPPLLPIPPPFLCFLPPPPSFVYLLSSPLPSTLFSSSLLPSLPSPSLSPLLSLPTQMQLSQKERECQELELFREIPPGSSGEAQALRKRLGLAEAAARAAREKEHQMKEVRSL